MLILTLLSIAALWATWQAFAKLDTKRRTLPPPDSVSCGPSQYKQWGNIKTIDCPKLEVHGYMINLLTQSCTCPDWQHRSGFPIGDMRRPCKHIVWAYFDGRIDALDDLSYGVYSKLNPFEQYDSIPVSMHIAFLPFPPAGVLLAHSGEKDWIDLIAHSNNRSARPGYDRYGISISRGIWAKHLYPSNSKELREAALGWVQAGHPELGFGS